MIDLKDMSVEELLVEIERYKRIITLNDDDLGGDCLSYMELVGEFMKVSDMVDERDKEITRLKANQVNPFKEINNSLVELDLERANAEIARLKAEVESLKNPKSCRNCSVQGCSRIVIGGMRCEAWQ